MKSFRPVQTQSGDGARETQDIPLDWAGAVLLERQIATIAKVQEYAERLDCSERSAIQELIDRHLVDDL